MIGKRLFRNFIVFRSSQAETIIIKRNIISVRVGQSKADFRIAVALIE